MNMVRNAAGAPNQPPAAGNSTPPPPRPPDPPSPRISCPICDFSFIVGAIATARCPNCGSEVNTGLQAEQPQ
ncbi:MAG: hypothetical protein ACT4OP_07155 [Actinomycetota bacterium]